MPCPCLNNSHCSSSAHFVHSSFICFPAISITFPRSPHSRNYIPRNPLHIRLNRCSIPILAFYRILHICNLRNAFSYFQVHCPYHQSTSDISFRPMQRFFFRKSIRVSCNQLIYVVLHHIVKI